ncbi:hypothetical protein HETIRDRAFT_451141 [Heterobasidion irregulare TC 32-1]|uniref:Uncharacterized protein n=1 Tax=Heterobasidion irregulare (strain TC 32-1) TaxID=747525 RepID=W4K6F6_HETIT|nr:uncharacterized protein HETIRDRAFT_451141 [Heterobasidion irregulare TC 32-1]ETW81319.1 hypothetical protein HETIRDRAFT_451141 [Heterobasidion irregulare TC 32-1]
MGHNCHGSTTRDGCVIADSYIKLDTGSQAAFQNTFNESVGVWISCLFMRASMQGAAAKDVGSGAVDVVVVWNAR